MKELTRLKIIEIFLIGFPMITYLIYLFIVEGLKQVVYVLIFILLILLYFKLGKYIAKKRIDEENKENRGEVNYY